MKASTKTKQPEWAMEIAKTLNEYGILTLASNMPKEPRERDIASIISQSPAIKELVEALRAEGFHGPGEPCSFGTGRDYPLRSSCVFDDKNCPYFCSALQPFKASTGGG